jgi:hypothetical protein
MAKPKQTAKVSTGGKAPRREIMQRAARKPAGRPARALGSAVVSYVLCESSGSWRVKFEAADEAIAMTRKEIDQQFETPIVSFCARFPGFTLDQAHARNWGLLESIPNAPGENEAEAVAEIKFVPGEQEQFARTPVGHFMGRKHSTDRTGFKILLYTVSVEGVDEEPVTVECRAVFDAELLAQYSECLKQNNHKKWLPVRQTALGDRPSQTSDHGCELDIHSWPVTYRSTPEGGCLKAAAANCLHGLSPGDAQKIYSYGGTVTGMTSLAVAIGEVLKGWSLERPLRRLHRQGELKSLLSASEKLEWVLSQNDGCFIVVPALADKDPCTHALAVDCSVKPVPVVMDSMRSWPMPLSLESLGFCTGGAGAVTGLADVRALIQVWKGKRRRADRQ